MCDHSFTPLDPHVLDFINSEPTTQKMCDQHVVPLNPHTLGREHRQIAVGFVCIAASACGFNPD
jgi:hypothetical protein